QLHVELPVVGVGAVVRRVVVGAAAAGLAGVAGRGGRSGGGERGPGDSRGGEQGDGGALDCGHGDGSSYVGCDATEPASGSGAVTGVLSCSARACDSGRGCRSGRREASASHLSRGGRGAVAVRAERRSAHRAAAISGTAKWPPSGPARAVPPARPRRIALDIQPTASVEVPGGASEVTVRPATVSRGTNKAPGSIARTRTARPGSGASRGSHPAANAAPSSIRCRGRGAVAGWKRANRTPPSSPAAEKTAGSAPASQGASCRSATTIPATSRAPTVAPRKTRESSRGRMAGGRSTPS